MPIRAFALLLSLFCAGVVDAQSPAPASSDGPVYIAYYWRAKPGQAAAYEDYIRTVAEKIDEDARQAGVFDEVVTVTPSQIWPGFKASL